jgi:RNA polymerase-binding protein DksA
VIYKGAAILGAKKVQSKKVAAKRAPSAKAPAKKAPAKKGAAKKSVAKKAPAKKAPAKKSVAKKAPAKKSVAKKAPAKKAATVKPLKKVVSIPPAKKSSPAKKASPAKKIASIDLEQKGSAKKATAKKETTSEVEVVVVEPEPVVKTVFEKLVPVTTPPAKGKKAAGIVKVISPRPSTKTPKIVVREDESPWTKVELNRVRKALDEDETRLLEEIAMTEQGLADLIRDSGDGAGDDQADAGSKTFEREHEMSLANNARDMLDQVRQALARIDDRTYGVCITCGKGIGKLRLQAFPRATLCMPCKVAEERI